MPGTAKVEVDGPQVEIGGGCRSRRPAAPVGTADDHGLTPGFDSHRVRVLRAGRHRAPAPMELVEESGGKARTFDAPCDVPTVWSLRGNPYDITNDDDGLVGLRWVWGQVQADKTLGPNPPGQSGANPRHCGPATDVIGVARRSRFDVRHEP